MILRTTLVNKIRQLGYTLNQETKRVHIFRLKGGTHFITLKKTDKLEDEFVRSTLFQAGVNQADINAFVGLHTVP